jgi:6-hydroxycyclohex-1-ene-1-carbonyl-CoA dehydrogenase
MADIPKRIETWQMVQPWAKDRETGKVTEGRLERTDIPVPEVQEGEVLVEIAGCGVCHTDLGYFYDGVPTVTKPPLTLGHEISGTVVAAICAQGRGNRCLAQKMPGNSLGNMGGFSSHIVVPAEDLCVVEERGGIPLSHLAVIADAATTPYQAAVRADLKKGDLAVIVGVTGGVGVYMAQVAKALGAKTVIGIARNPEKLERALKYGVDFTINSTDKGPKDVQGEFRELCKSNGLPHNYGWKIFEITGTAAGQEIALTLLSFIGKLLVIGFGMQKNEYSISRLMAFDADIIGTWGCLPKYYPAVLEMVLKGQVQIQPFLETRPMSEIQQVFQDQHEGKFTKRIVLTPDF